VARTLSVAIPIGILVANEGVGRVSIRRILTIFRRDFRDAVRDARILVAVLVPFALGIFYNVVLVQDQTTLSVNLAYTSVDATNLPEAMKQIAGPDVTFSISQVDTADIVKQQVDDGKADLGLVVPAGFDAAVQAGQSPPLMVMRPDTAGVGPQFLLSMLDAALREQAGQQPPAQVQVETVNKSTTTSLIENMGMNTYFVLSALIMQVAMITMYAVPYILAEEKERRTLDALVMVASYWEVIAAKALFGIVYVAISTPLLLAVTRISPHDALLFGLAIGLLAIVLDGVGLMLGSLLKLSQLTSWGGMLVLPVVAPAFVTGLPAPKWVEDVLLIFPTTHAMRMAIDALSQKPIFGDTWQSILVLAIWAVAVYAITFWTLSRREI